MLTEFLEAKAQEKLEKKRNAWKHLVIRSPYIKYINIHLWQKKYCTIKIPGLSNMCDTEIKYSPVHDRLMLLHMQAFGFMKFEELKTYKLFNHIPVSNLDRHSYKLLNCSSVYGFNEMNLDPFKVRDYF